MPHGEELKKLWNYPLQCVRPVIQPSDQDRKPGGAGEPTEALPHP